MWMLRASAETDRIATYRIDISSIIMTKVVTLRKKIRRRTRVCPELMLKQTTVLIKGECPQLTF